MFVLSEDRTPLHIATQQGNVAVVELLIDKYKASLHHRTKVKYDRCNYTLGYCSNVIL